MPKGKFGKQSAVLLGFLICTVLIGYAEDSPLSIGPQKDPPVSLRFFGSATADRFTRELDESFQGVLQENFLATAEDGVPAGFVNASLPGFPWAGTMWSRDGGTFMRELVMRGYYRHAALLAECLIDLVQKNREGFYAFPEYFKGSKPGPGLGAELDGTSSIVIGMALLWERLPQGDRAKDRIYAFLFQEASPVNYLKSLVKSSPLAAGTGEFGCGVDIPGECYNVVQNNLTRLALLAAAEMARESGSKALSEDDQRLAVKIQDGMEKYLVNKDGSWIWCIDVHTLKPNRAVLESAPNRGFGGTNGVASMYADVRGLQPLASRWSGVVHSEKTFQQLYNTPLRTIEFERFLTLLRDHPQFWAKVTCPDRLTRSGPPGYDDVVPFAAAVVEEFPDRVLWGTDWPHPNMTTHMPDDGVLTDMIPRIAPTAAQQQALLVDNPMRLYWER